MPVMNIVPSFAVKKISQKKLRAPVFLFCAVQRTGSTLLQRIINGSGEVFIWGEPRFLRLSMILHQKMAETASSAHRAGSDIRKIDVGTWIPTIYPDSKEINSAVRALFTNLYLRPLKKTKFKRWGFKEVADNAGQLVEFMHSLYPGARFVFLTRHPMETYRSLKNMQFLENFHDRYHPVKIWAQNTAQLLEIADAGKVRAMLIRYEDLTAGGDVSEEALRNICNHIGVDLRPRMRQELQTQAGASTQSKALTKRDREVIRTYTKECSARLGYEL